MSVISIDFVLQIVVGVALMAIFVIVGIEVFGNNFMNVLGVVCPIGILIILASSLLKKSH